MSTPVPISGSWPSLTTGILSSSLRIISSHTRHFLSLSLLFLLPLSSLLLLLLTPSLLFSSTLTLTLAPPLLLLLLLPLLLLSSLSSISHSVDNSFGRPVRLLPSLSSLPSSLPRLLLTLLLLLIPALLLSSPFLLLLPPLPSLLILSLSLLPFSLALPIAALEPSPTLLHPLRRSAHLVKPLRPTAAISNLALFFGPALIVWGCGLRQIRAGSDWFKIIARTVLGLAALMGVLLYWMVTSVVMYLYCKAVQGELAEEIAREFAWEYVCLPFDDAKVPRVVSVVPQ